MKVRNYFLKSDGSITSYMDQKCTGSRALLNAVAANANAANRTLELPCKGFDRVTIQIVFTRSAGTAVVVTPSISIDDGTTYGEVTSRAISAGAGTVSPYADTRTTSASKTFALSYPVHEATNLKLVFSVTGGGASDTLTVQASGILAD